MSVCSAEERLTRALRTPIGETKQCEHCTYYFPRPKGLTDRAWLAAKYCSYVCSRLALRAANRRLVQKRLPTSVRHHFDSSSPELQELILEQARDLRWGSRVYSDACSLDALVAGRERYELTPGEQPS